MLTYTAVCILGTIIILVINFNMLFSHESRHEKVAYKRFVSAVLFYYVTDTLWPLLNESHLALLTTLDTMALYFAMTLAVMLCYRYVVDFLKVQNRMRKYDKTGIVGLCLFALILLVINWYARLFFWIDENGFHTGSFRNMVMLLQVAWFGLMAFLSFQAFLKSSGTIRDRNHTIFLFGLTMTGSSVAQWIYPYFPFNTVGFGIGLLIIHVFIHEEDEKQKIKEIRTLNDQMNAQNVELQRLFEEKKIQEENYRKELTRLQTMLEQSGIGTWTLISQKGCPAQLEIDEKMRELMGLVSSHLTAEENCEMLIKRIHPEDLSKFMNYDKLLKTGVHAEVTYRWNHPFLGERYLRCGGVAVKVGEDDCISNGYHYDVTELILKEKDLQINIEANKAKTRFLQNMSHEMRTPLNAMFGFAQLLGMPDGSWTEEEKEDYNSYIYNSYNMIDLLISDILDIADSDHGNYRITLGDVQVNSVCKFALKSAEGRCPSNVELKFTTEVEDDYTVHSDARRIQQVLVNYLTNACKNTEKGEIHLHCSVSENPGKLTFSVTDTGKGVPPEDANKIFGRFTKLDRNVQGSGLGLNICNTIATKLNGKVFLDTTYTGGARFVFVL